MVPGKLLIELAPSNSVAADETLASLGISPLNAWYVDMERPCKFSRGGLRSLSGILRCSLCSEVNESAAEVGRMSTVDHADIRGSAGAAFMVIIRRELPRTGLADLAPHNVLEDSPP